MRPVTIRRWYIAAAAVLWAISLIIAVQLSYRHINNRVDAAEKRITHNSVSIRDLHQTNTQQNRLRAELVRQGHETSLAICNETEKIKARIRAVAHFDPKTYAMTLTQLGIDPLSPRGVALLAQAKASSKTIQRRFAAKNCRALTFPPKK